MNLIKKKNIFFTISALFILPSLLALGVWGLKPSIDFTGGSHLDIAIVGEDISVQTIETIAHEYYEVQQVKVIDETQYSLVGAEINNETKEQVLQALAELGSVSEIKFETVGPILGKELIQKTIYAILLVAIVMVLYVWKQFKELKYGVCAILGMFHDSIILLGAFSFFGHYLNVEVDVLFVTALLTTLSLSIHDTIVIYDRIRELSSKHRRVDYPQLTNLAILETLVRSVNNSLTIIFMLLAVVLLGGMTMRWFAVALLIGAISGTYSSTFIAVPLLVVWDELKAKSSQR